MLSNRSVNILCLILVFIGLALFLYKWLWIGVPVTLGKRIDSFLVEAKFAYQAEKKPSKVILSIPNAQPNFYITQENYISPNYGLLTTTINNNRQVEWTKRRASGREVLYYQLTVVPRTLQKLNLSILGKKESIKDTNKEATPEKELQAEMALLAEAKEKSSDLNSLVSQLLLLLNDPKNQTASQLLSKQNDELAVTKLAASILHLDKIQAQPILGLLLDDPSDNQLKPWLLVQDNTNAVFFNPSTGQEDLPDDFLIWHVGASPVYKLTGGRSISLNISKSAVLQDIPITQYFFKKQRFNLMDYSLHSLPIPIQHSYGILMVIPLGAIIILFFRNFIGIDTFGIFMPVLIGMSFLTMTLEWGLLLYFVLISFGLLIRFYLDRLTITLVPRLAVVLSVVVLFMAGFSVITHKIGIEGLTTAALFPIVILTMTIEKMCNLWDERGATSAIKTGFWSLVVASSAYFVMKQPDVQYLLFNFPELNLITIAVILLLGQYRGFRLTELKRFKVLASKHHV